ncbi:hypothetical protein DDE01_11780 [Desulfovibrio desulfuricans]|nr:hypothetical protein DDE01_11780 [Desulfovibrio desulfuricans]
MNKQKNTGEGKRKAISKRVRFEVFKRDSFTCQYCGRKAPDVILHVDHISPRSKGGSDDIMNYVTSCAECNLGKSNIPLADDSAVEKSRKQAEALQQRREQIDMMREWQLALVDEANAAVDAVDAVFQSLTDGKRCIAEGYKPRVANLISQYGLQEVIEALRSGASGYGDACTALDKLAGICLCRKNPHLRRRAYIAGILKRRLSYFNQQRFNEAMDRGYALGGEAFFDQVEYWARQHYGSWTRMITTIEDAVESMEK